MQNEIEKALNNLLPKIRQVKDTNLKNALNYLYDSAYCALDTDNLKATKLKNTISFLVDWGLDESN